MPLDGTEDEEIISHSLAPVSGDATEGRSFPHFRPADELAELRASLVSPGGLAARP